ncbi:TPA: hypothetical protein ACQGUY_006331 [Pseudomonas aeruginosa]|uniref:hypothetical protein n=1 Tax=Pseudomonas aeruginosa TaxID=287 RepID=UPI00044D49B9|nr:hypothetical protein [Pseudomonas aeruginosa]EIU2643149.1 hypothetical protein [Pseudomonas aeruginosa]EIU4985881.1 hypothetical protein [Pseudomonas aeruginosa]EIU9544666.1 hypothetical protein [Pseudomonas aeruginosa]EIU9551461.1 hypothetical protein [Pseudomonas aeruginosa]EIY2515452.1 hypothetical protein [Pseudomonas aeruginosa]
MAKKKALQRTLQLKPVQFSKPVDGISLYNLMVSLNDRCPIIRNRLHVKSLTLQDGTVIPQICYFYNNFEILDDTTCKFEVWSYEPGVMPHLLEPNPDLPNAVIPEELQQEAEGNAEVQDGEKDNRELIHISHVLVFGKSAIIECTRGTGGVHHIQSYLNRIMRDLNIPRPSNFYFTDAVSGSLKAEIDRAGGAIGFTLGMSTAVANAENPLVGMLSSAKQHMANSSMVTVGWSSKTKLDTNAVVQTYEQAQQQDEIESVIIHLKDKSTINSLSKFKIKRDVEVADIGGKNPSRPELWRKMLEYLEYLTTPDDDGNRILDETGALAGNETFIPLSRRNNKRAQGQDRAE